MADYYKSIIIEKYPPLSQLDLKIKDSIKLFYVFGVNGTEVLYVTLDDGVYAFGANQNKCLGLGLFSNVKQPTKLVELCDKRVIKFDSGSNNNVLALTINGVVYAWGHNNCGQLGFGNTMNSNRPQIINGLSGVLDIACGGYHSLALTISGELYAFGSNSYGQIGNGCSDNQLSPIKISAFGVERVITIACGFEHSLVSTESGRVFGWGSNEFGQLSNTRSSDNQRVPKLISTDMPFINKIQCGRYISWLLSSNCHLFTLGSSDNRLEVSAKILDIATSIHSNIAVGISENQECVVWDENGCHVSSEPLVDDIISVEYVIAAYTGLKHTINSVSINGNNDLMNVYDRFIDDHSLSKYSMQFNQLCIFRVGEFGKIAKSFNRSYSKIFAIKKRKVAITASKAINKRNNREIEILRQLNCDNIIGYYGHWHEKISVDFTYCFIQLEYCAKRLNDVIDEIYSNEIQRESRDYDFVLTFSLLVASELFTEILEGVNYLHSHTPPIIHRNLTDKNVLITNGNNNGKMLKICGFRNATLHQYEDMPHTIEVGTVGVMAPEVAIGSHYNTKADMYSLGTVMMKLFDIDINDINSTSYKTISSISLFNSYNMKFMFARKLLVRLLSPQAKKRPNCEQILRDKHQWALAYDDIKHEYNYDFLLLKTDEKSFFRFFVEIKLAPVFRRKKSKYLCDEFSTGVKKVPKVKERKVTFDKKFTGDNLSIIKLTKNGNYVNKFNELEFIGSGGFGAVFKIRAKGDDKLYAIKKVPLSDKIGDIQDAAKELSFLSQLKGDYIVNSIDFWLEDNYYLNPEREAILPFNCELQSGNTRLFYPFCPKLLHIQMELCNHTLRTVLKELQTEFFNTKANTLTPIGYYISSELFIEILECVDYIHKQKPSIIHRDLKPDNILLVKNTSSGRFVKLADFGLATIHAFDGKSHTEFRGTVKYMAPEVVNSRTYDTKADVFSLGIIAQQLFVIDINKNIRRTINPLLNQKYECMHALVNKLLSPKTSDRLDCHQMLSEKDMWRMSLDELKVRSNVEKIIASIQSTQSINETFCKYFLKSKIEI